MKDSRANYAKAYQIASAMVENWWRLGLELDRLKLRPGKPKANAPPGEYLRLADLGINDNQSSRCQRLAEMSKAELDDWLDSKYDEDKYYLPSLTPAAEAHVASNSGEVEWYTPPIYLEAARTVLGGIDLDPCSSKVAQENVKAKRYYTAKQDGLKKDW